MIKTWFTWPLAKRVQSISEKLSPHSNYSSVICNWKTSNMYNDCINTQTLYFNFIVNIVLYIKHINRNDFMQSGLLRITHKAMHALPWFYNGVWNNARTLPSILLFIVSLNYQANPNIGNPLFRVDGLCLFPVISLWVWFTLRYVKLIIRFILTTQWTTWPTGPCGTRTTDVEYETWYLPCTIY